jgi:hypothetical protein
VRSAAEIEIAHADRLARQMARHFAHKVDVAERDGRHVVTIEAGVFELAPDAGVLRVHVEAVDEARRARVEEVCADHLRRFARAPLPISWSRAD